ncbi:hypothetical protein AB6A40_010370 [Gnathostoma spinigerum]|uniref:Uncharacterized protein n=1 Tax=Gnathostoma spinigerum TaxID=75299 RepID=A0ABD6EUW1_9BILA
MNERVEELIDEMSDFPPDVIVMQSCLWDVSQYGDSKEGLQVTQISGLRTVADQSVALNEYKHRMVVLMEMIQSKLPARTKFIWLTTPFVAESRSSSLLQINRNKENGFLVHLGNHVASQIVRGYGHDVIDLEYYFRHPWISDFQW